MPQWRAAWNALQGRESDTWEFDCARPPFFPRNSAVAATDGHRRVAHTINERYYQSGHGGQNLRADLEFGRRRAVIDMEGVELGQLAAVFADFDHPDTAGVEVGDVRLPRLNLPVKDAAHRAINPFDPRFGNDMKFVIRGLVHHKDVTIVPVEAGEPIRVFVEHQSRSYEQPGTAMSDGPSLKLRIDEDGGAVTLFETGANKNFDCWRHHVRVIVQAPPSFLAPDNPEAPHYTMVVDGCRGARVDNYAGFQRPPAPTASPAWSSRRGCPRSSGSTFTSLTSISPPSPTGTAM